MRMFDYLEQKTEEAQFSLDPTGLMMPKVDRNLHKKVVDKGVKSVKNSRIAYHNVCNPDLDDKIMRSVPVPLANGETLVMDLKYKDVLRINRPFALERLAAKKNRGQGMVDAAEAEAEYFSV